MLTSDEQIELLRIARRALASRVRREIAPVVEGEGPLAMRCGAFVSIHRGETLRGCLGRLECDRPLVDVVVHLASVVADSDPRFAPVDAAELDDLEIEISVLAPEREVASIDEIEIGRHGLIVEQGHRRGLLLPQVASEHGWGVTRFLEHACLKAGLPADAWQRGARVYLFEAQVFNERAVAAP